MHLPDDQIEPYQRRALPRPTLAAIDVHISSCLYCSRSLSHAAAASGRWERRGWLGRLVRVEEPQPIVVAPPEEPSAARAA
jgi:hypothetical protein